MGIPEKIKQIEDEIHITKVNKATEHHLGILKAKLAKLRREQETATTRGGGSSLGYDIKRSGDATVVIIGLPSVGKSTLLNKLTNAKSKVGTYQFTTRTVVPGIMEYKGARIQILDLPGIIKDASTGKGMGRRVLSVARNADVIVFVLDVFQPEATEILRKELRAVGIRPDERPANVTIEKTATGGVAVHQAVKLTKINERLAREILNVYGIHNARVSFREDVSDDQLIDVLLGTRVYPRSMTIINKIDLVDASFLRDVKKRIGRGFVAISAEANANLEAVKQAISEKLDFIRVYMRPRGSETDYKEPLIMKRGSSVLDVCNKIHRNLKNEFRYAQVWGKSAKFGGQRVGLDYRLLDEDVLTFVSRVFN
ncbi:MAG: OBG GTPase family GTP-binding protein [Candidatus Bathyarchaeia archaeon]